MVLIKYYIQQLKKVNLTHVNWLIQGNKILDLIKYCASHLWTCDKLLPIKFELT